MMPLRARTALVALAAAAALGGCGLGAGRGTSGASVVVTQEFGARDVGSLSASKIPGSETVMRMLQRSFRVQTRYGGGFVQSIDGHGGGSSQTDWFYYVNGVQAAKGAATTAVHHGDRIWWDLHDWHATDSVPAVVGSFPEPFVHGVGGKRLPTTLECGAGVDSACKRVTATLTAAHVPVSNQGIGGGSGVDSLAVVVATWRELKSAVAASLIDHGPSASGVYARFTGPSGGSLQLLNPQGRVVRTLGSGAGLVAATADSNSVPTWLITGTDAAGVSAAARALNAQALHDHFALAVDRDTRLPVPLQGAA
jgi:hypothetical protein